MHVPEGFTTLTPYFFVNDAAAFIDFLCSAFTGEEVLRSQGTDGRIANAQVRIGTSMVMLSEATERYPAMPGSFYLYVENADETMQRAVREGAEVEMPVADMSYGDRQGGTRDPFGNLWWVSQRLVDGPYA